MNSINNSSVVNEINMGELNHSGSGFSFRSRQITRDVDAAKQKCVHRENGRKFKGYLYFFYHFNQIITFSSLIVILCSCLE